MADPRDPPAADGAAGDAPAPRPRKRKAAGDEPKVDLTNLDMLACCFEWELARFLAQAWTRSDAHDSKKSLGLCHCTFLFNYLAGGVMAKQNEVLVSFLGMNSHQTKMWVGHCFVSLFYE